MTFGTRYIPQDPHQRQAERNARNAAVADQVRRAPKPSITMGGCTSGPAPKTEPHRNPALLDMARDRPCLLLVPGCCNHRLDTTVACHSNKGEHGKAGARKADDEYSVWGCAACHRWLDQGTAPVQVKDAAFMAAHLRQVLEWRRIATDASEPERFRKAAQWALDQLAATPIGETA